MTIPNIWENKKCSKPPTSQLSWIFSIRNASAAWRPNFATVACHEQQAPKPRVASLKLSCVLVKSVELKREENLWTIWGFTKVL